MYKAFNSPILRVPVAFHACGVQKYSQRNTHNLIPRSPTLHRRSQLAFMKIKRDAIYVSELHYGMRLSKTALGLFNAVS